MLEREVSITNALGLHARAAAKLVRLANTFRSSVTLTRTDTNVSADGKDILGLLQIAAGIGVDLKITVEGIDEQDAIEQITKLFADKFGEDQD
ncbi:MAG: HPr family phosphocarrier protein [Chloracidobacterium sp.]|nr:HPr family phosphocarrier protein [Chloracidobacterium sp.]